MNLGLRKIAAITFPKLNLNHLLSKFYSPAIVVLLVVLLGAIDYLVTIDIALSIFYLVPVVLATWFSGRQWGIVIAFLSAIAWGVADRAATEYSTNLLLFWNSGVRLGYFLIISHLLTQLKISYECEKQFARTDALTGVFNSRFFYQILELEIQRSQRQPQPITVAYIDLDNFKQVNDTLGHQTGDRLLSDICKIMTEQMRKSDVVARLGGDEFALLFIGAKYDNAKHALERLHQKLAESVANQPWSFVGFSIGAVTYPQPPSSVSLAIEQADQLMYAVKKSGKNQVRHVRYGDRML
jgi:diguanylate cyclase (GGDEF)-like protein